MSGSTARRLAGIAEIFIDGVAYDLVGDLIYSPSSIKRETLIGQSGVQGYKEMPVAGFISANLRDNGGIAVSDFNAMTSSTVQIALANGKQVLGTGCWAVETQESKTEEGVFEVKFESDSISEMLA